MHEKPFQFPFTFPVFKRLFPLKRLLALLCYLLTSVFFFAAAQEPKTSLPLNLKKLTVEELMNIEVTIVSKSPQKLSSASSAVQVITGDDLRRSGATNIPDALRLVSNLQVAQLNSNSWIISSRGFNSIFANKLLVMIDGRSVYNRLFAGVFWDMQHVLMEDVDRIEVVSGPGGTLWGANAVNGIINIVTKSTKETTGLYASVLAGTFIRDDVSVRYGGKSGENFSYKVFGQHFNRNATIMPNGKNNNDAWNLTQAGFKAEWNGEKDNYSLQGNHYSGTVKTKGANSDFNGQNITGLWNRKISESSDARIQVYYDRYFKANAPGLTSDRMNSLDMDLQYRAGLIKGHSLLSGIGYRIVTDHFTSGDPQLGILPGTKNLDMLNAFLQDEIRLSDKIQITAGTKFLHNVYTGFEFQPGIRLALVLNGSNNLWAAVSRAVRTPSRIDVDYFAPAAIQPPGTLSVAGGPNFKSEKALSYELGYRVQPNKRSSLSFSTFYTNYKDVYSLELLPGTLTYQALNGTAGRSWGMEFSGTYHLTDKWQLRSGYTYFDMNLRAKPGHTFDPSYLANDVQNQAMLQSMLELPLGIHLDLVARYLDYLPQTLVTQKVPAYFTFDARLAYTFRMIELSLVGQNLYEKKHTEFSNLSIPRSCYAKFTVRL